MLGIIFGISPPLEFLALQKELMFTEFLNYAWYWGYKAEKIHFLLTRNSQFEWGDRCTNKPFQNGLTCSPSYYVSL